MWHHSNTGAISLKSMLIFEQGHEMHDSAFAHKSNRFRHNSANGWFILRSIFEDLSLKYQLFHLASYQCCFKEWWLVPAVHAGPSTASSTTLWSFSWRWIRSCLMTARSSSGLRKTSRRRSLFVHPKDSTFSLGGWIGSLARFGI